MGRVATAMVLLYHVFFGLGFSTVPWVYSAEVNSLGWRTRGAAAATSVNWIGGFVVVQITKIGLDHLQWRFFLSKFCPHSALLGWTLAGDEGIRVTAVQDRRDFFDGRVVDIC